jgi:glycosyltransferase involved in cell wall biosynthesis
MARRVCAQGLPKRACIVKQGNYPADLLVRREAEALRDDGFEVDVICHLASRRSKEEEVINRVHVYRLPVRLRREGPLSYVTSYIRFFLSAALKLTSLHLRHRYALIQVNNMPDFLVFATLIPRLMGAKIGLFMYEPMPELWAALYDNRLLIRLLGVIQRLAIGYAHVVFAVTQQQKETFVARGADEDKIAVILNVPDIRLWEQFVPETTVTNEHFTLICHGAIKERYGHDTMLQAVKLARTRIPNLRLRVLGHGNYRDEFLAQIKAMGLETSVQYLGCVSLSKMVEELHNADVGIVAQKSSPYSNLVHTGKMYDFLAFGKPVLASRLKAVQAYFGEKDLRFFEPGDAESLAEGILDLSQHPDRRQALVENSQRLYRQYEWEKQKEIYLSSYRALLE